MFTSSNSTSVSNSGSTRCAGHGEFNRTGVKRLFPAPRPWPPYPPRSRGFHLLTTIPRVLCALQSAGRRCQSRRRAPRRRKRSASAVRFAASGTSHSIFTYESRSSGHHHQRSSSFPDPIGRLRANTAERHPPPFSARLSLPSSSADSGRLGPQIAEARHFKTRPRRSAVAAHHLYSHKMCSVFSE